MKKILSAALASLMLLGGSSAVFADDAPAVAGLTLADTSHLVLDTEKGYVDMIDGTITVADLKAEFASAVTVTGKDGVKADDKAVATDDVVSAADASLKALIYGDVDRNGKITLTDASGIMKLSAKWDADINTDAADVDKNGKANLADASKLLKFAAGWDDISLGNVRLVFDNTKITAEHEDDSFELFFTSMMNKTLREDTTNTGENAYKIKLAKNEAESCQFIITSAADAEGLSIEMSDFVHEYGEATLVPELNEVFYYPDHSIMIDVAPVKNTGDNWYWGDVPEALFPMSDSFEIEAGMAQHFTVTVTTDKDTPAGMYSATLMVKNAEGQVIKQANVYTYVWDFTLPDRPASRSLFSSSSYIPGDGVDYFNLLLDNNLSSYKLPVDILSDEANAYMDDPRITDFIIAGGWGVHEGMYGGIMQFDDDEIVAMYEKLKTNPEWLDKGLFYWTDEPYGTHLVGVRESYEYTKELIGTDDFRSICPLAGNNSHATDQCMIDGVDPVEYINGYVSVWCPQSVAFHLVEEGGNWTPRRYINKYGEFADRAEVFKERGDEMWWYVCCSPEVPYANYFTWYQGVIVRLLSWQQYFNDVEGVLYYGIGVHWNQITKHKFNIYNGDGVLAFPGEKFGFEGPMASWRLFQIRDGFDDFDYMALAEAASSREDVMEIVRTVTTGMLYYTEDYRVLEAARDAVVDIILADAEK